MSSTVYQNSADLISRRYFDGFQVLFPDVAENLKDVIARIEDQVSLFNDIFTPKRHRRIQLEPLQLAAKKMLPDPFSAIDQAKAEALIFIGENRAAIEFVEKLL